jgi:hypothetical protein
VLPQLPARLLRIRVDDLDAGRRHGRVRGRERVDGEAHDRRRSEELVVGVLRAVHVHLRAVREPEPRRARRLVDHLQAEDVPVEGHHAGGIGRPHAQPGKGSYGHRCS